MTQATETEQDVRAAPLAETIMPSRRRLPDTRVSITHKFEIGDYTGYICVGLFPDGKPGEVFLKIGKEGTTVRGLLDCVGILTSVSLQYGVPIEKLSEKLTHVRFEPSGPTSNADIPIAKSIVDYVFRWLAATFSEAEMKEQEEHC